MWVAFAHCKSYSHLFSKKFRHICVSLYVNFNESFTNYIVSFEPRCSKLMMLLVNVSLKRWSLNKAYTLIFFAEKMWIAFSYSHFFSKTTCELDILTRTVNSLTTNELVKLTMLWTTGPWIIKKTFSTFRLKKQTNNNKQTPYLELCKQ